MGLWLEDERLVKEKGWKDLCHGESSEEQGCILAEGHSRTGNMHFPSKNVTIPFHVSVYPSVK